MDLPVATANAQHGVNLCTALHALHDSGNPMPTPLQCAGARVSNFFLHDRVSETFLRVDCCALSHHGRRLSPSHAA